jgi:hypothetical protein
VISCGFTREVGRSCNVALLSADWDAPAAIVEELHSDVRIVGCSGGIGG